MPTQKSSRGDVIFRLRRRLAQWQSRQRIRRISRQVAAQKDALRQRTDSGRLPKSGEIIFFNVSSRLAYFSLNAAFSLITSWMLRLAGTPVRHFACHAGMTHCLLGTQTADLDQPPPCSGCIAESRRLYHAAPVTWFTYQEEQELIAALRDLSVEQLSQFEYPAPEPLQETSSVAIPLGMLVLPSVRWILRRHTLKDDAATRRLLCQYILSAYSVAREFAAELALRQPAATVIFNGHTYPEATARWVASQMGIRNIAYEVGFQAFSAFFTNEDPTAYPIYIPDSFELTPEQTARLDAKLEKRFQGQFTMAGIRFWPEMRGLDEAFLHKAAQFRQVIPVFTNVIYDTSQVHANTIFLHMFAWLDSVLEIIRQHPDTLFIIRAHPDEKRPGSKKLSNESVSDWVAANQVHRLPNVIFIDSQEYLSSYELIQRSKFVMVYNSSIGLEASLMGALVVCGGRARYNRYPTAYLPDSASAYRKLVTELLDAETVQAPEEHQRNARRFLYYQFYRVSIPFEDYLQEGMRQGQVFLKPFRWQQLLPDNSLTAHLMTDGILNQKPFILPEEKT